MSERKFSESIINRIPVRAASVGITSALVTAGAQTGLAEKAIESANAPMSAATSMALEVVLGGFALSLIAGALNVTHPSLIKKFFN